LEMARSLTQWAALALDETGSDRHLAAAAAKSRAGAAAVHACEVAIQVHGGIGFTWESVLHRYYKRAMWLDAFEGDGSRHRASIAAALLPQRPETGGR
jgi:alkylation response protein AidB-like acyl-CoA dehydrogenase